MRLLARSRFQLSYQIFLTADGPTIVSANQGTDSKPGDTVSVIDAASMAVRTVPTGSGPVTNLYDDTLTVVDLQGLTVISTVGVGDMPNGVSFSAQPPSAATAPTISLRLPTAASAPPAHAGFHADADARSRLTTRADHRSTLGEAEAQQQRFGLSEIAFGPKFFINSSSKRDDTRRTSR